MATGQVAGESVFVHDVGSAGRLYLSGRCRLDNRRELLGRLRLSPDVSDAELIVHAYLAFGSSHPEALLGDFAYALFDARERRLWLVRDHMGVVPLYYHQAGDLCIASPSLDAMLAQPDIPRVLNDGVVAEWCVNGHVYNQTDTFYSAIKKVPRATQLRLDQNTTSAQSYWSLAGIAPIQENREPVLVEQLHDLLHTAIIDRLCAEGPQGSHLSGGLDSTPIAVVAGRACRRQGRDFHTWNWCKPEPSDERDCHEWTDARRVAQNEGFIHHEIAVTPETLLQDLLQHDLARDGTTMFMYERLVLKLAEAEGVNRIFSGFGGDEILTTRSRDRHTAALRSGSFFYVHRRLVKEGGLSRRPVSVIKLGKHYASLLKRAWWPTPQSHQASHKELTRRAKVRMTLLKPEFASFAISYLHDRSGLYLADSITEQQLDYINVGYHQERIENWAILGSGYGIHHMYPLLDKRLVEFALALSGEWYYRCGQPRYLYRQALGNILPFELRYKPKQLENERVSQLVQSLHAALVSPESLKRVEMASSPFVETHDLLTRLNLLRQNASENWEKNIQSVWSITNALLTLNIGQSTREWP